MGIPNGEKSPLEMGKRSFGKGLFPTDTEQNIEKKLIMNNILLIVWFLRYSFAQYIS